MGLFQKAEKSKSKLRCAIFGPSGSGKTYTSLRMATGMGGKIAVIDSERESAQLYADRFKFDTASLNKKDITEYVQYIKEADKAGYNILIIDSLTHAWHELLSEIDKLAKSKYKGNTWSAWSEGTPKQRRLVSALLDFDGHIISTMRSKTEWTVEKTSRGTNRPVRVGLAPEQGKGIEYEFTLLLEMSPEHICTALKDRTGKFQDVMIEKPGEDFGKELIDWLNTGKAPASRSKAKPKKKTTSKTKNKPKPRRRNNRAELTVKQEIAAIVEDEKNDVTFTTVKAILGKQFGVEEYSELNSKNQKALLKAVREVVDIQQGAA